MSERLERYVAASLAADFAESGIFNRQSGSADPVRVLPPAEVGVGVVVGADWEESSEGILQAALAGLISWERAAAASRHVGRFILPEEIEVMGRSVALKIERLLGWERLQLEEGGPWLLNLRVNTCTSLSLAPAEPKDWIEQVQVLIAPSLELPKIGDAEIAAALDEFDAAAAGVERL